MCSAAQKAITTSVGGRRFLLTTTRLNFFARVVIGFPRRVHKSFEDDPPSDLSFTLPRARCSNWRRV